MCVNNCSVSWVSNEFQTVAIRDERLVKRLIKSTEHLAKHPEKSIPEACGKWSETKATYRLIDNDNITPEILMMGHKQQTIERMKGRDIVLAVQDTTMLDYTDHPSIEGIGLCSKKKYQRGLLVHSTLAITPEGTPLGLLDQHAWTRAPNDWGKTSKRNQLSIENKESGKWLKALDRSLQGIPDSINVVTVCDREADIYDFINKVLLEGKHFLIRVAQNRLIVGEHNLLKSEVEASPVAGEILVQIPRDIENEKPPREAKLSVRYCSVIIKPPLHRKSDKTLSNLKLYAILAKEADHPKDSAKPIEWLLLTSHSTSSLEDVIEKINWYKQRWKIERFHFTLKSGCKIEDRQFETVERLYNVLVIYSIIAWKLLFLSYKSRTNPDIRCDIILKKYEWKALYSMVNKMSTPPDTPPTLKEAVLLLSKLGGFLARKSDGDPGVKTLWRGMQRLEDISQLWLVIHPEDYSNDMGKE